MLKRLLAIIDANIFPKEICAIVYAYGILSEIEAAHLLFPDQTGQKEIVPGVLVYWTSLQRNIHKTMQYFLRTGGRQSRTIEISDLIYLIKFPLGDGTYKFHRDLFRFFYNDEKANTFLKAFSEMYFAIE
jgi:hypothetical protein